MKFAGYLGVALLGILSLSACSLAGDIPPPADYYPPVSQEAPTVEAKFPLMPPDPTRGKAIYDVSCEPCHGETGLGNGSQAADLPVQVPLLGNAETAREVAPVNWYNTVTNGNIERFMPPFAGSLTDRQRWDVVAYAYTLSMQPDQLAEGAEIFAAQCQDCHGENGQGDGLRAVSDNIGMSSWSDPSRLAQLSNQQLWEIISDGMPEKNMPAYASEFSEKQRWAVTKYVRSLGFAPAPLDAANTEGEALVEAAEAAEPQALDADNSKPQANQAAVRVSVINGSGEEIPEGLPVSLIGFDDMQAATELNGVLESGSSYVFEDVEKQDQRVYLASVEYNDLTFYSDILRLDDVASGEEAEISVTVYESSTDTTQLSAERVHIFLEFPEAGRLQIAQLFLISNPTGRVIIPSQEGAPVLEFVLPEGAEGLQFADSVLGERYIQTARGFGDTANIPPGNAPHQVLYVYELPYDRKQTLQLSMPLPVRAAVVAMPDVQGLRLTSPQLVESGQRQVEGANLQLYNASNLSAGSVLEMTISGRPGSGPLISSGPTGNLVMGAGMLLLVLALGFIWIRRQRQSKLFASERPETVQETEAVETLLDAIVALDDLYWSGELPVEAYKKRRTALKERLRIARMGEG
jgi:mono/diheme cytochrome c family protein